MNPPAVLHFSPAGFDAVIALGGSLPDAGFFALIGAAALFAADGGALGLAALGIAPDAVIGDFDALTREHRSRPLFSRTAFITDENQELNDLEKAARHALGAGKRRLLFCGFQGGDLDHTLNNWSVLMKLAAEGGAALCVYDNGRYAVPVSGSVQVQLNEGEIVSLIPQPAARLTTCGLQWALNNEELRLGVREGARNRAVSDEISLELHSGSLLLCFDARLPFAPVFG